MRDGIVALTGVVHRCFTVSGEQQMRSCLSFSRMGLRGAELVEMTPNYWSFFAFFSIPIFSTARQDSSQVTCCFHVFNNSLRCMPCPRVAGWKCNEGKLLNMKETLNIWRVASIIYLALIDRRYLLIFCDTSVTSLGSRSFSPDILQEARGVVVEFCWTWRYVQENTQSPTGSQKKEK